MCVCVYVVVVVCVRACVRVCVNDLSMILNGSAVGLTMCNMKVNHLFYADDLCVIESWWPTIYS